MKDHIEDLYDYDVLRATLTPTMFVLHLAASTLVLGGSQSLGVLDLERLGETPLRRRRGGGGLVLLQPDDLWIDWWIPTGDARWSNDVRASSIIVGEWWAKALTNEVEGVISVHTGALEGEVANRAVCFAGKGPGEVFVDGRKAVGLTQWRVREGIFISTVLHASPSYGLLEYLKHVPDGIDQTLDHQTVSALGIDDPDALVVALAGVSGPWQIRHLFLNA